MSALDRLKEPLKSTPLVGEDDEFDPFARRPTDPPPYEEGDDSVHAEEA